MKSTGILVICGMIIFSNFQFINANITSTQNSVTIESAYLEFYDLDTDTVNDTVEVYFLLNFIETVFDSFTVNASLFSIDNVINSTMVELTTNVTGYQAIRFPRVTQEDYYQVLVQVYYDTSYSEWESDIFLLDGFNQFTPYLSVIYDFVDGDYDGMGWDGIEMRFQILLRGLPTLNVTVTASFLTESNELIFTRVYYYTVYPPQLNFQFITLGEAPFNGNFYGLLELKWHGNVRDTFITRVEELEQFYHLSSVTLSNENLTFGDNNRNSIPDIVGLNFQIAVETDMELDLSMLLRNAISSEGVAYFYDSVIAVPENTPIHSYSFDPPPSMGSFYITVDISYHGFLIIIWDSDTFYLDGPDPNIELFYHNVEVTTFDSGNDGKDDSVLIGVEVSSNGNYNMTMEFWIWSQGDEFNDIKSYDIEVFYGSSPRYEIEFGPVNVEWEYYVDLFIYHDGFPEYLIQYFGLFLYPEEEIHSESVSTQLNLKIIMPIIPIILAMISIVSLRKIIKQKSDNL